jgi:hypothetical protein
VIFIFLLLGIADSANNELLYPYGITRDSTSDILYIADYLNHRIMGYEPSNNTGFVVAGSNGPGLNNTQLNFPIAVYFDSPSKSLIIVNIASNNIVG